MSNSVFSPHFDQTFIIIKYIFYGYEQNFLSHLAKNPKILFANVFFNLRSKRANHFFGDSHSGKFLWPSGCIVGIHIEALLAGAGEITELCAIRKYANRIFERIPNTISRFRMLFFGTLGV